MLRLAAMGLKRGFLNTENGRASLSLEDSPMKEASARYVAALTMMCLLN